MRMAPSQQRRVLMARSLRRSFHIDLANTSQSLQHLNLAGKSSDLSAPFSHPELRRIADEVSNQALPPSKSTSQPRSMISIPLTSGKPSSLTAKVTEDGSSNKTPDSDENEDISSSDNGERENAEAAEEGCEKKRTHYDRLKDLESVKELLSKSEYESKRKAIIDSI